MFFWKPTNNLVYSYKTAEHWCTCLKNDTIEWKSYRRAMKLFEQYRTCGDINPSIIYTYKEDSINILPDWSRRLLLDFLLKKKKEENSVSTISMYRSSCLRFLKFLEQKKISRCAGISPEIIKEFHVSDLHSTAEARNAYSIRIRGFLDYLSVLGYVPETLPLALSTECAVKTEIVETLTDEEVDAVYHYRTIAEKPMALRNTAMVLIGLRMGLRASDITGLKLTDIAWDERTISTHQQKSGRFLKLPMPVDVGNSLYQYITNGRPPMVSEYVFISHRVPYSRLGTGSCCSALNNILDKQKHGFHLTRKTFATRLLISKTNTDTIADSLGHKDNSTVMKYLATDGDTMRQCSLSLKGIDVKGGLLS
jgi:Site-specific recombinase XerD